MDKHVLLLMMIAALFLTTGCATSATDNEVKQRSDYRQKGTAGYRMAH